MLEGSRVRALQEQKAQEEAERVRPMTEDERQVLLEGLKSKWEQAGHESKQKGIVKAALKAALKACFSFFLKLLLLYDLR